MNTNLRSTIVYLTCGVVGLAIMWVVWIYRAPAVIAGPTWGIAITLPILGILWIFRKKQWAHTVAPWLFFITTLVVLIIICLNHEFYVRTGLRFEPFIGCKILAAFIPLICPPSRGAGWGSLALVGLVPIQRYYEWDVDVQTAIGIQEPWVTLIFAVGAGVIYEFRRRLINLHDSEVAIAIKLQMSERLFHFLLGTQHLLSTPLQTIELLVNSKFAENPPVAKSFERAFSSLRRVIYVLSLANQKIRLKNISLPQDPNELEAEFKKLVRDDIYPKLHEYKS